jgi:apolipoprotein N-acyltransferase
MLRKSEFWLLVLLAALAAVLAIANMFLFQNTRNKQADVAARQQFIQQTLPLEVLQRELIRALANLATRDPQDSELRKLLSNQGLSVKPDSAGSPTGVDAGVNASKGGAR